MVSSVHGVEVERQDIVSIDSGDNIGTRMIRRRRGQCERCAYPVGTSERCTECGAAVIPAQRLPPTKAGAVIQ